MSQYGLYLSFIGVEIFILSLTFLSFIIVITIYSSTSLL